MRRLEIPLLDSAGMSAPRRICLLALVAALGFATSVLPGCGGGDDDRKLLSRGSAGELRASLDDVEQKVSEGDCSGARADAVNLQQEVDALPRRTSRKLRRSLAAGATRLVSLVDGECEPAITTETTPTETNTTDTTEEELPPGQQKKDEKQKDEDKGKNDGGNQDDEGSTPTVTTPNQDTTPTEP